MVVMLPVYDQVALCFLTRDNTAYYCRCMWYNTYLMDMELNEGKGGYWNIEISLTRSHTSKVLSCLDSTILRVNLSHTELWGPLNSQAR